MLNALLLLQLSHLWPHPPDAKTSTFPSPSPTSAGTVGVAAGSDPRCNAEPAPSCRLHGLLHLGGGPVHPHPAHHGLPGCQRPRDAAGEAGLQCVRPAPRGLHHPPDRPHKARHVLHMAGPPRDEGGLPAAQQQPVAPQEL